MQHLFVLQLHTYFSQWGDVAQVSLFKQSLFLLSGTEASAHWALCDRLSGMKYLIV